MSDLVSQSTDRRTEMEMFTKVRVSVMNHVNSIEAGIRNQNIRTGIHALSGPSLSETCFFPISRLRLSRVKFHILGKNQDQQNMEDKKKKDRENKMDNIGKKALQHKNGPCFQEQTTRQQYYGGT